VTAGRIKGMTSVRLRPTLGVRAPSLAGDLAGVPVNDWEKAREDRLRGESNGATKAVRTISPPRGPWSISPADARSRKAVDSCLRVPGAGLYGDAAAGDESSS
jgi:hypothetical protein